VYEQLTGLLRKKTETPPTRGAAGIRGRRITRRLPRICTRQKEDAISFQKSPMFSDFPLIRYNFPDQ